MFKSDAFKNKTVLVTGGSRGIGKATVELFARLSADVIFFYRSSSEEAKQLELSLKNEGHSVEAYQVDITDRAVIEKAISELEDAGKAIDVLVNNAGIVKDNLLAALQEDDIQSVMNTNVLGTFNVTQVLVPYMVSRRSGNIINVSSVSATKGGRGQTNYAASKGAIEALTKALSVELASRKIRVNAVAPGVIETEMSRFVREKAGDTILSEISLKRFGKPEEIADAIAFLASDAASYINGTVLQVDGGFKMG